EVARPLGTEALHERRPVLAQSLAPLLRLRFAAKRETLNEFGQLAAVILQRVVGAVNPNGVEELLAKFPDQGRRGGLELAALHGSLAQQLVELILRLPLAAAVALVLAGNELDGRAVAAAGLGAPEAAREVDAGFSRHGRFLRTSRHLSRKRRSGVAG